MGEITKSRVMGLDGYVPLFIGDTPQSNSKDAIRVESRYIRSMMKDENYGRFSELSGDINSVDTYLEFALASYYSPAVVQIRPAEAKAMLPADEPKLSGLILGENLYKEIQVLRFLADTDAVGRYEGMLKFVCDKNGVTRAETEKYYRDNIRGFIAGIVDEEFNKISFSLNNVPANRTYHSVLTRNLQTGEYTLSYERPSIQNSKQELTAQTLDALLVAMRDKKTDNKPDFVQSDIDTVRAQAVLIPAVVYADWKSKGVAGGVDALGLITETLTNFYLNPSRTAYEAILGIYARYANVKTTGHDTFSSIASYALDNTLKSLNLELLQKATTDILGASGQYLRIPNDRRYDIFSVPYGGVR